MLLFIFSIDEKTNQKNLGLFLDPWKLRKHLILRIANRCARLSSTAHRCGARLFYYSSKK